ncbi:uncharacterized protein TRAVEDRAFT_50452 [Trametes versicolor FP-101664 SS1]|uniref:uncharacterized protein n=1 Tax=Trametes versicolor (strain FP-101664) TaxID=717944 RepID=UPI0004623D39|nr:uncharacterized protein TRAVEDRAFT_50452 [Trametes versicolor FP-101664 SS1]EIW55962.1 hypothetical protein TRAVEDRAFT_50452 [Trametes versicolor FP-101664 SS1]
MISTNFAVSTSSSAPHSSQSRSTRDERDSLHRPRFSDWMGEGSLDQPESHLLDASFSDQAEHDEGYSSSASLSTLSEQYGTQGDEGGSIIQSSAFDADGSGYTHYRHLSLTDGVGDEPDWSAYGADFWTLDAGIPSYDLPGYEENNFVLETGAVVDHLLHGYLPEHQQEGPDLLPLPFEYDYSTRPAEVVARINSHPSTSFPFPSSTTGRGPQSPLAHAFDTAPRTIMSAPLPQAGPSGLIEDAPPMVNPAQPTMQLGGGKRLRSEEDTPRTPPRPSKKSKGPRSMSRTTPTRPVVEANRASRAVAAPRPASPVAGPSNFRGSAAETDESAVDDSDADSEVDDDSDHADDETAATGMCTKRARRTKAQVAAVTRTDLQKVHCPVDGCTTMFDPLTHDANRNHLKLHYPEGALDNNASLPCLWAGCMMRKGKGKPWTQTRKPGTTMITHLHKDHVGQAYTCPVEGCTTWASSRSGDLPQHLARNHKGWRPP